MDVVLLTEEQYENMTSHEDWYIENLLTEDRMVQAALARLGATVKKVGWSNPTFDWAQPQVAVFRTTWDYFHRFEEFDAWLQTWENRLRFVNPISLIRWNMDKRYLKDLEAAGIRITPTHIIEPGTATTLTQLHEELGWQDTILKPAISGAARHTYRLQPNNLPEHEDIFQTLIAEEAMLLQPFQHNILTQGEVSHVVIGGRYTHSVLKIAKPGDFRVQDDFGGTIHDYTPTQSEIEFSERAVAACPSLPAYARVDVLLDNEGEWAIGELEMIEPELWFRRNPSAAEALAQVIMKDLQN